MGQYLTAQICLNGHHTTDRIEFSPELMSKYCSQCGKETITQCTQCSTNIRGEYDVPGSMVFGMSYTPPSFCHACGKPYPWTEVKILAAQELADEIEELNSDERDQLKKSIVDLTTDSPSTDIAVIRYKKLLAKSGKVVGPALNKVVTSIATAAVKLQLGL